jgi:hypothetical protein
MVQGLEPQGDLNEAGDKGELIVLGDQGNPMVLGEKMPEFVGGGQSPQPGPHNNNMGHSVTSLQQQFTI